MLFGLLGSLMAGLMTSVGALPVPFGRPSDKAKDVLLGIRRGCHAGCVVLFSHRAVAGGICGTLRRGGTSGGDRRRGHPDRRLTLGLLNERVPHQHFIWASRSGIRLACKGMALRSGHHHPQLSRSFGRGSRFSVAATWLTALRLPSVSSSRTRRRGWSSPLH